MGGARHHGPFRHRLQKRLHRHLLYRLRHGVLRLRVWVPVQLYRLRVWVSHGVFRLRLRVPDRVFILRRGMLYLLLRGL